MNAAIKQIADVMRRANYAGALQYVPELSWILFLRILDEREEIEAEEAAALGIAVRAVARGAVPLAGLGGPGRAEADRADRRGDGRATSASSTARSCPTCAGCVTCPALRLGSG